MHHKIYIHIHFFASCTMRQGYKEHIEIGINIKLKLFLMLQFLNMKTCHVYQINVCANVANVFQL
jgi:hypothetical protein